MDERIRRALARLDQGVSREMDIVDIADELGLSLHHFHRLFVAEVGETPAGYLRRVRLDAAALRLRWTNESISMIAQAVGYGSQAALTRAFIARFQTSPGLYRRHFQRRPDKKSLPQIAGVFTRTIGSYSLLSRRYFGSIHRVREFWTDFSTRLPDHLANRIDIPYVGLVHDDPHVTVPEQIRYDCCAVIPCGTIISDREAARHGLYFMQSRAGLYAGLTHVGHRNQLEESYRLLTEGWLANSSYAPTEDPMVELHVSRRDLQPIDRLEITLLCPIV